MNGILLSELQATTQAAESVSLLDLLLKGGFMMIPILLLSMLGVYIFVERFLTINKATKTPETFMDQIKQLVLAGDISAAKLLCGQTATPIARMIEKGISRIGNPMKNIEVTIENV